MVNLVKRSVEKFELNLAGLNVLTEAASGNYRCTPLLAMYAGANVFAVGKDSRYGKYEKVIKDIRKLAKKLIIDENIKFFKSIEEVPLEGMDIVTNTGFVRPINKKMIDRLKPNCVIPLMYEPWEFRSPDLDIEYCAKKGIKVYGTNESDPRLKTMDYIGYTVLYFLLKEKLTPTSGRILLLGSAKFNFAIENILNKLGYDIKSYSADGLLTENDISRFNVIVLTEFVKNHLLIGDSEHAIIKKRILNKTQLIIHIAGNVNTIELKNKIYPKQPANPNFMSYTTDFIDPVAVVDLHCAGLKVAEGMVSGWKKKGFCDHNFKEYLESNYPALSFPDKKYW